MSDILLPPWLNMARVAFKYVDSTGVSVAPYTGAKKTASWGGDRIAASLEFTMTGGASGAGKMQQAALIGFLTSLKGKQNRAYLHNQALRRRGSFPTGELLLNSTFESGTGWASSDVSQSAITFDDRVIRAFRVGVATDCQLRANQVTVVSGAAYAARLMSYSRKGPMAYRLFMGTTIGATNIAASAADITTGGLQTLTGIASGTALHFCISDRSSGGRAIGDHMDFSFASVSRCILVNGASQVGSALTVDQLPASTAGLLLPGDPIEVLTSRGSEYKIVTATLNANAAGQGSIYFEPPLRGAVADNAAVIVDRPMSRCIFMGDVPTWENTPGVFTTSSADFEEVA